MVLSMTAFGRGESPLPQGALQCILSSVNRRHLDIVCVLPQGCAHLEPQIRRRIQELAHRGMVNVSITKQRNGASGGGLMASRAAAWEALMDQLGPRWEKSLSLELLTIDPAPMEESSSLDEPALQICFEAALQQWQQARLQEGSILAQDLLERCERCREWVDLLETWGQRAGSTIQQSLELQRQRWESSAQELQGECGSCPGGAEQEAERVVEWAAAVAKADATEEIVRLRAHLARARQLLERGGVVGKALEFLWQEMLREANTCAAKMAQVRWGTAEPIHIAVELKTECERLREQSQNLE